MKKASKGITALLVATVFCLGLGACGSGNGGFVADTGVNPAPSPNVIVKSGTVATDSWGYTGSAPLQVSAPSPTEILIKEHTLLEDASHAIVSGTTATRISFSSDKTTLTKAAQDSTPANTTFVSYVNISMESAKSASPALSVTVDVGVIHSGETLTVYNYDPGTGTWISVLPAVVNSLGKITFLADQLSLWGIFQ